MSSVLRLVFAWRLAAATCMVACIALGPLCHGGEPTDRAPAAGPQAGDPLERYVLLTNGQVLRGRVLLDGDRYVVSTSTSEMRIPREDVEHVCRSLAEGYQLKRAAVLSGGGRERLRLIQWCFAQNMLDEAEAELNEAQQQPDANNPRYDLLRRRLKLAREPARPAPPPAPLVEPPTSDAQLDVLVRTLPGSAVETFSQTVQPLLLKNCAAAGCHGALPRSDFQLIRLARGVTPTRKVTQRNLHAALAWIDRGDPEKSKLLTAAAQAHGNTAHNKFEGTEGAVFRHLAQWVQQVSRPNEAPRPESVQPTESTLSQSISSANGARPSANATRHHAPTRKIPTQVAKPVVSTAEVASESNIPAATAPPSPDSADPFDPEQFNRRFHGEDAPSDPSPAKDDSQE